MRFLAQRLLLFPRSVPLGAKQRKEVARSRHNWNCRQMFFFCTGLKHSLISFGCLRAYSYKLPGAVQVRVLVVLAERTEPFQRTTTRVPLACMSWPSATERSYLTFY